MIEEERFVWVTLLVPFVLGYFFFSHWLFRDLQVRWDLTFVAQLAFASTLAVSFQTHAAILGEVSGTLTKESREILWEFDFSCLIILLKVVLPFFILFSLFTGKPPWNYSVSFRIFLSLILETLWLAVSNRGVNIMKDGGLDLQAETEKLGMIGLGCVAILSGWGSVYGPYYYGPWFIKKYDDAEIRRVEEKLISVMEMRTSLQRRVVIQTIRKRNHHQNASSSSDRDGESRKQRGFVSFVRSWLPGAQGAPSAAAKELQQQIQDDMLEDESLNLLSSELFMEYDEMKKAKAANLFRKTLLGRIYTLLGYTFAGYCIFKMIASCYGLIFPKTAQDPDLITKVLQYVLLLARNSNEAHFWAQGISFFMVGVLVFNSFRGLLMTMGKLFHQFAARDSSFFAFLLTEIMGQYLMSSIILLDLNVPVQYRGKLFFQKFEFFRVWSDALFLIAGLASVLTLYAVDRASKSRTEFYHTTVHEKLI